MAEKVQIREFRSAGPGRSVIAMSDGVEFEVPWDSADPETLKICEFLYAVVKRQLGPR